MSDHILERMRNEDLEFERELSRMTIRELERTRARNEGPQRVTNVARLTLWLDEVRRRVKEGRVAGYKGGLRAGLKAEHWEAEPEGLCVVLPSGMRLHEAVRQQGGPQTARRCLVIGHRGLDEQAGYFEDLFHIDAADAIELRDALGAFLAMRPIEGGGARQTAGDRACARLGPWEDQWAAGKRALASGLFGWLDDEWFEDEDDDL